MLRQPSLACVSWFLGAILVVACTPSRKAAERGDAAVLASTLEANVRAEWGAIKDKNDKAYGELLDDDFLAVEVDAEGTRTKAQALRELGSGPAFEATLSR